MYSPSFDEIAQYKEYDVIPVSREIYADVITPITLLRKIADKYKNYYLLESIEGGEKWARYSFFGFDPKALVIHLAIAPSDCEKAFHTHRRTGKGIR